MKSKKGELSGIVPIVTALIVVGLILGISLLIFSEFRDVLPDRTTLVINESIPYSVVKADGWNITYNSNYSAYCYRGMNVVGIYCGNCSSTFRVLDPRNYTVNNATGQITNLTAQDATPIWNVTYTFVSGGASCNAVASTENATNQVPLWLTIITILAITGILLAIVFSIRTPGESSGGSSGGSGFSFKGFGGGSSGDGVAEI